MDVGAGGGGQHGHGQGGVDILEVSAHGGLAGGEGEVIVGID
jgi:hypothetical protein